MIQATTQHPYMIPTGTELPEARKSPGSEHAGLLLLCLTLCNPVGYGLPGFSVQGILRREYWSRLPYPSRAPYFLLRVCSVISVVSDSLRLHGSWPARLLCPWDSPGKNIGMGCHLFPSALDSNPLEYLVLPGPLWPKQMCHLHTWPSLLQIQVLQGSLRSKPLWTTHMQRWR